MALPDQVGLRDPHWRRDTTRRSHEEETHRVLCYVDEARQNQFLTTPKRNRLALSLASPRASRSAYAPELNTTTTPKQAPNNASFYQDLAGDLAKLAAPNNVERLGEAKVVGVESKGNITLVVLVFP